MCYTQDMPDQTTLPTPIEMIQELDRPYIRALADEIHTYLASSQAVACDYQPGNGTRYEVVFTPLLGVKTVNALRTDGSVSPPTQDVPTGFGDAPREDLVLISVASGGGCWALNIGERGYLEINYLKDKLSLRTYSDACAILALIAEISGSPSAVIGISV